MRWLCKAKPAEWRAMTSEERKSKSLQKAEWVEALKHRKKAVSPLFALPGISNASMKPDWMHVADEGCCALAAGQVLSELLSKREGSSTTVHLKAPGLSTGGSNDPNTRRISLDRSVWSVDYL